MSADKEDAKSSGLRCPHPPANSSVMTYRTKCAEAMPDVKCCPRSFLKSEISTETRPIGVAVHKRICAETRSPFQPDTACFKDTGICGATDFGKRLSMVTNEACNPSVIVVHSENVLAVGTGCSQKWANTKRSRCA